MQLCNTPIQLRDEQNKLRAAYLRMERERQQKSHSLAQKMDVKALGRNGR